MPTGVYNRKPMNQVTKEKISIKLLGNKNSIGQKGTISIRDEQRYNWKGENVSYSGLHKWVVRALGKPNTCEHCGRTNLSGKLINWANKSHEYKRDLADWVRLCTRCHGEYDKNYSLIKST